MDFNIGSVIMMISKLFGLDPDMEGLVRLFALIFVMAFVVSMVDFLL